ncbi:MAG TPA: hypothetical protein PKM63_03880 [Panacibacter sp.]|nr:hypothetical protein [Panacibacter sp.]HNP43397.1 hypothetical protein [Panacibacter sp.]
MKGRPLPVVIVAVLFILAGVIGFFYHLQELLDPTNLNETVWILLLRILAVVCGVLLLFGVSWARWLAIGWLLYHVVVSALNSTSEMIAHIVFLTLVTVLLFLPASAAWFQDKKNPEKR